ncbi:Rieske 2Fe-2S domain-containing protein [Geodermatophilus ruber]|uniref:Rieske 2Fe-2S domain-containing protein n=1 Tax=Geodermatophilus ruber TaxID=504800 RepID=UPI001FE23E58|nr:Rieske 2Fe-2S domain-containing protein [Geodermatophilus ruber]
MARAAEVGTTPVPVGAGGRAYVVVRLRPGGEVSAFPARCPHRLAPLARATVVDERLECAQHAWRFNGEGRCVAIPALGPEGTPPPRADLPVPWAVEERHGWIWLAPDRTAAPRPPRPLAEPAVEPVPVPPAPRGPVLGNLDRSLRHAWHPVALSRELRPGGWLQVRLLGGTWTLRRGAAGLLADQPAYGVREHLGLVWLAPEKPRDPPFDVPEDGDRRFVTGWLPPLRSPGAAGSLADAVLDAADHVLVPAHAGGEWRVDSEPGGFRGVRETDDGCRAGYVHRAPFRLRLRLESADAVTTVLFLLQPEDPDSTRLYTRLLLSAGPGAPLPGPADVGRAAADAQEALARALALQARGDAGGLPLSLREELHLPCDRLGVALRRALADFAAGR